MIGPNLVGMGSPYLNFNCGFIPYLPIKGPVSLTISQSGANLLAALGTSQKDHFGMSFFVGLGNKADVDFCEFVSYAGRDENSKCLAIYIEGLDSPDAFIEACRSVDKPIVTIKLAGRKLVKKPHLHTLLLKTKEQMMHFMMMFLKKPEQFVQLHGKNSSIYLWH